MLIADAVRRRDRATAVLHLEALRQISPFSQRNLTYVASLYEALGENDEAAAVYAFALQVAPEAASLMVEHGQFLLRQHFTIVNVSTGLLAGLLSLADQICCL